MTRRMKRGEKRPEHNVGRQNLPQSLKRHKISEISDDDETSAVTRPYGIRDKEEPDDVVSIPDQSTIRQQTKDFCGEGDDEKALDDDLDPIMNPITPTQQTEFLGFIIDTTKMAVTFSKHNMTAITDKSRS